MTKFKSDKLSLLIRYQVIRLFPSMGKGTSDLPTLTQGGG